MGLSELASFKARLSTFVVGKAAADGSGDGRGCGGKKAVSISALLTRLFLPHLVFLHFHLQPAAAAAAGGRGRQNRGGLAAQNVPFFLRTGAKNAVRGRESRTKFSPSASPSSSSPTLDKSRCRLSRAEDRPELTQEDIVALFMEKTAASTSSSSEENCDTSLAFLFIVPL